MVVVNYADQLQAGTFGLRSDTMSEQAYISSENLVLRVATMQDTGLLLEWRNDTQTRAASHNQAVIQESEHSAWLTAVLADNSRTLYIAEENGIAVGSIHADNCQGFHELSWTVAPEARGRGIAKCMVALLADHITGQIRAEIKTGNQASCRVAEHAGMRLERTTDAVLHYYRPAR